MRELLLVVLLLPAMSFAAGPVSWGGASAVNAGGSSAIPLNLPGATITASVNDPNASGTSTTLTTIQVGGIAAGGTSTAIGAWSASKFTLTGSNIGGVAVHLRKDNAVAAGGTVTAYLYTDSAGLPSTDSSPTGYGLPSVIHTQELQYTYFTTFWVAMPVSGLTTGTSYWLVLRTQAISGGSVYLDTAANASNLLATAADSAGVPGTWTGQARSASAVVYGASGNSTVSVNTIGCAARATSSAGPAAWATSSTGPGAVNESTDAPGTISYSKNGAAIETQTGTSGAPSIVGKNSAGTESYSVTSDGVATLYGLTITGPSVTLPGSVTWTSTDDVEVKSVRSNADAGTAAFKCLNSGCYFCQDSACTTRIYYNGGGIYLYNGGTGYTRSNKGYMHGETASQPTCNSTTHTYGVLDWCVQGGTGVADFCQRCMKNSSDTYQWVDVSRAP